MGVSKGSGTSPLSRAKTWRANQTGEDALTNTWQEPIRWEPRALYLSEFSRHAQPKSFLIAPANSKTNKLELSENQQADNACVSTRAGRARPRGALQGSAILTASRHRAKRTASYGAQRHTLLFSVRREIKMYFMVVVGYHSWGESPGGKLLLDAEFISSLPGFIYQIEGLTEV